LTHPTCTHGLCRFPPHNHAVCLPFCLTDRDSLVIGGTQDLTISDIPTKAGKPETIYFFDNDLAIVGGLGYWQGATGFLKYYDTGSITAGSTLIAGQEVDTLKAESEATFYVYRPRGGLSMSA
jgi:hypothetical protein